MKKIITITSLIIASAELFGSNVSATGNGTATNDREYKAGEQDTITRDGAIMKHYKPNPQDAPARHFDKFVLNTGTYTGTQFLINETRTTETGTNYVAFNGATFKSSAENGNQYKITVGATDEAKKVGIFRDGFTVDNVTVDFNLAGKSVLVDNLGGAQTPSITVKNNGVLNYRGASSTPDLYLKLNIENGSVMNAYFDYNSDVIRLKDSNISGIYKSGRTQRSDIYWYGANTISNQKAGDDAMYVNGRFSLEEGSSSNSLTISNSEVNSIICTATKQFIMRGTSTLTLNSKNAMGYKLEDGTIGGQDNIILQIGAGSKAILNLGADNSFDYVMIDSDKDSTLNVTLAGNKFSLNSISDDLIGTILIKDFAENLFNIASMAGKFYDAQTGLLTNIKWGDNKDTAKNLYWDKDTGFVTAIAIPEPSTYAVIVGALALGFVAYRRRK